MGVTVLRLGHRLVRDARISTHVALIARALGADRIVFSKKDSKIKESVEKVVKDWGGDFRIETGVNWRNFIKNWKGEVIHLTIYGMPIKKKIGGIRKSKKDKLVVVGAEKVPAEVYELADYNVSVSSQPHSECAALAVFLHEYFQGKELGKRFPRGRLKVVPQEKGKRVVGK